MSCLGDAPKSHDGPTIRNFAAAEPSAFRDFRELKKMTGETQIDVRLTAIRLEASGVQSFEFKPSAGGDLPAFAAGAHIDLQFPTGLTRSYSLINPQNERHRYVVAVQRETISRGGSKFLFDTVRVGDTLKIVALRNTFPLAETAQESVFFAGGIGITPLYAMIQRLTALGRNWSLHYCVNRRERAPFLNELEELAARSSSQVTLRVSSEIGKRFDLKKAVAVAADEAHLYCCGPKAMLQAFKEAAQGRPPEFARSEAFQPTLEAAAGGFTVSLARSGLEINVADNMSILDALLEAGVDVPYSCREGVCGTCEVSVLEGIPDHRDEILSEQERAANKTMMICRSGCKSGKLVLDV
jgi:tetrachlorobenzoquinone reductase